MSKHLGNILEPLPLMEAHGADALRWFMACSGSPWSARRVGHTVLQDVVRKTLLTYWNTVAFQSLYARTSNWTPDVVAPAPADRPAMDRWALSEAHRLARDVDAALADFDTQKTGRLLAAYVDDLSNWYVRRCRRRFWAGDPAALATLHECLRIVTLLSAPLIPFITERVWQDLFRSTGDAGTDSIHLAAWPEPDASLIDDELNAQMGLARRLVELGRAARADSAVKTRQPLSRALIGAHGWTALSEDLRIQIAEELNVTRLESLGEAGGDLVDYSAKANFRALGKRFGKGTQPVAAAIAAADPAALAAELRAGRPATIVVDGAEITVDADEVIITETPREGWSVAREGETVALDLAITPELRRAGLAREAVRAVQDARKSSGLEVTDRIRLEWHAADPEAAEALREHADLVAAEVLATSVTELPDAPSGDGVTTTDPDLTFTFRVTKA
jgi:isoleucyl-tRNA synthetase